jgi:hypothetical protein
MDSSQIAIPLIGMADDYLGLQEYDKAMKMCLEGLKLREAVGSPEVKEANECRTDILKAAKKVKHHLVDMSYFCANIGCVIPANKKCEKCLKTQYCSNQCQAEDTSRHIQHCVEFEEDWVAEVSKIRLSTKTYVQKQQYDIAIKT